MDEVLAQEQGANGGDQTSQGRLDSNQEKGQCDEEQIVGGSGRGRANIDRRAEKGKDEGTGLPIKEEDPKWTTDGA